MVRWFLWRSGDTFSTVRINLKLGSYALAIALRTLIFSYKLYVVIFEFKINFDICLKPAWYHQWPVVKNFERECVRTPNEYSVARGLRGKDACEICDMAFVKYVTRLSGSNHSPLSEVGNETFPWSIKWVMTFYIKSVMSQAKHWTLSSLESILIRHDDILYRVFMRERHTLPFLQSSKPLNLTPSNSML